MGASVGHNAVRIVAFGGSSASGSDLANTSGTPTEIMLDVVSGVEAEIHHDCCLKCEEDLDYIFTCSPEPFTAEQEHNTLLLSVAYAPKRGANFTLYIELNIDALTAALTPSSSVHTSSSPHPYNAPPSPATAHPVSTSPSSIHLSEETTPSYTEQAPQAPLHSPLLSRAVLSFGAPALAFRSREAIEDPKAPISAHSIDHIERSHTPPASPSGSQSTTVFKLTFGLIFPSAQFDRRPDSSTSVAVEGTVYLKWRRKATTSPATANRV
ncbi:hypothetical protein Pelo_5021 [Pelomyxa schiedti]|nr:hypothetical protein Pelo_5021 [Pelomyxa schiedti]